MTEYKLSENTMLVIEDNWTAIKRNGKLGSKHIITWEDKLITEVKAIDENTALLKVGNETAKLKISGVAITIC